MNISINNKNTTDNIYCDICSGIANPLTDDYPLGAVLTSAIIPKKRKIGGFLTIVHSHTNDENVSSQQGFNLCPVCSLRISTGDLRLNLILEDSNEKSEAS